MIAAKILTACILLAAETYDVPPAVLMGIYQVEGGRAGQEVANTNGTYDLGPMQINTVWIPELADYWGVSTPTAHQWVRDDPCTNTGVAAWILRQHMDRTDSLSVAIGHYHSKTKPLAKNYRKKVMNSMKNYNLINIRRPIQ